MDISDPRNIMVDANDVLNTYINKVHGKKVKDKDVRLAHK